MALFSGKTPKTLPIFSGINLAWFNMLLLASGRCIFKSFSAQPYSYFTYSPLQHRRLSFFGNLNAQLPMSCGLSDQEISIPGLEMVEDHQEIPKKCKQQIQNWIEIFSTTPAKNLFRSRIAAAASLHIQRQAPCWLLQTSNFTCTLLMRVDVQIYLFTPILFRFKLRPFWWKDIFACMEHLFPLNPQENLLL